MCKRHSPPHGVVYPPGSTDFYRCLWLIAFLGLISSTAVAAKPDLERKVYIPATSMDLLMKEDHRGILLSQEEYQKLRREATSGKGEKHTDIPINAAIISASGEGKPQKSYRESECVEINVVYNVQVLAATWTGIPFEFKGTAPIQLQSDSRWMLDSQTGCLFLYGSGAHSVSLRLLVPVRKEAGKNHVAFTSPLLPTGSLLLHLPGRQEICGSLPMSTEYDTTMTHVRIAMGGSTSVELEWYPSRGGEAKQETAVFAQSHLAYALRDGVLQITGSLGFSTLSGDLPGEVCFLIPPNGCLRKLDGPSVRNWRVEDRLVTLVRGSGTADRMDVELSIEIPFAPGGDVCPLPVLEVAGVTRHYGEMAVVGSPGLRVRIEKTTNLEAIDTGIFFGKQIEARDRFMASYQFFSEPVSLSFWCLGDTRSLDAKLDTWVEFRKDAIHFERSLCLTQQRGETPRITVVVPTDEEYVSLVDAQGQPVDADIRSTTTEQQIRIELIRPLRTGEQLVYILQTTLCPTQYHQPGTEGIPVLIESAEIQEASFTSGTLAVGSVDSLQLRDVQVGEMESAPKPQLHPNALQSFFYRDNAELLVRVARKPAEARAMVLIGLLPREGFLSVHGEVRYLVEGGGQKQFQIAFPKGLGASFFPESERISERNLSETDTGDVWTLLLQDEAEGEFEVRFHGEIPMNGEVTVPEVWIPGAKRERGYFIVEANTETEIAFQTEGLSSLDPTSESLPRMNSYAPSRRLIAAFEYFVHPCKLHLKATRHTPEPVLSAMADSLMLTTVLSKDGLVRSQAVYAIRGVRIPFLNISLPAGSELWTARVAGEPVKPMHGEKGSIQIPLGDSLKSDTAVEVGLVFETRMDSLGKSGSFDVLAPRLSGGVPVAETTWQLFVPEEYVYTVIDSDLKEQPGMTPEPLAITALSTGFEMIAQPNFLTARREIAAHRHVDMVRNLQSMGYISGGRRRGTLSRHPQAGDQMSAGGSLTIPQDEAVVYYGYDTPESKEVLEQDTIRDFETANNESTVVLDLDDDVIDADSRGQAVDQQTVQAPVAGRGSVVAKPMVVDLADSPSLAEGVQQQAEEVAPQAAPEEEQVEKYSVKVKQHVAGLLPLDIQFQPQGVEYVFRDLRAGEHIAMSFRRVESQNWRDLLKVICAALLFFLVIRERNLIQRSVWTAFILSALSFVLGEDWTAFCNQLLMGVFLGIALALVVRLRNHLIPKPGMLACLFFLVMVSAGNATTTTVYIPYDQNHPESVTAETRCWLPHEDFTRLWQAAKANQQKADPERGPFEYSLDCANYTVTIGEASLTFMAGYCITQATGGWVSIPFPFDRSHVESAHLDGQPALLEATPAGCCLHLGERGSHQFEVTLSCPRKAGSLTGSMVQAIPLVSLSTVRVLISGGQLGASIHPIIGGGSVNEAEGHKEITAAIGKCPSLEVKWFPETPHEQPPVPLKANIQIQHCVVGNVENWKSDVYLQFQGEKRSEFLFITHPSLSITSVQAPNLAGWRFVDRGGERALQVQYLEDVSDSTHLQLTAERVVEATQRSVPLLTITGVQETAFRVALFMAPWLDLRVDTGGFQRVEAQAESIPGMESMGTYETSSPSTVLKYEVLQRPQEVTWRLDYLFQVSSRKIEETVLANLDIRRHPLYRMSLSIPAGYRCERVEGQDIKDWWQEPGDETSEGHVRIDFHSGLLGTSTMVIHLINLLPEDLVTFSIAPVHFATENEESLARFEGTVVVAGHSSVTPHPIEENGLVSTTLCDDKTPPGQCEVGGKLVVTPPLEKKLAYRTQSPDFSARFSLDRTPLRYGVVWVTLAEAHETWISCSTHLQLKVLQGSLRTWEFLAPASLGEIEVKGDLIRETSSSLEGESRRYSLLMDTELFGETTIDLSFEIPVQGPSSVPHLSFPDAERSNGYLLTANDSSYELKVNPKGALERAQRADIPFLPRQTGILDLFKVFRDDWNLELDLAHTVSAETLDAFIDWVDLETLIRRDGTSLTQANIRISNKSLQFLPIQLPQGADLLSLKVAGEASGANSTVRDDRNTLLVPLIRTTPGQLSFVIEVVYEGTLRGPLNCLNSLAFEGPDVLDIPVAQTLWTFYVPEDYEPFWLTGNMEETTETVREFSKLASLEEERQQLKTLIVGNYDFSTRQRAYENYEKASAQVQQQQSILEGRNLQQEIQRNRRLKGKALGIQGELGRTSHKISSGINQTEDLSFRENVDRLQKEASAKEDQTAVHDKSLRSEVGSQERIWISNQINTSTPAPSEPQRGAEYQQISSNAYFFGAPLLEGKRERKLIREEKSQYLNLAQPDGQQNLFESQVMKSNQVIEDDLSLSSADTSQTGRGDQLGEGDLKNAPAGGVGGMEPGGPMPPTQAPIPPALQQEQRVETSPDSAAVQIVSVQPPQLPAEVSPKSTGAFSIPVSFPHEGDPITFRKLHANAKVRFEAIDRKLGERALKTIVVLLLAGLMWGIKAVSSSPSVRRHLHRHWFEYLALLGVLWLPFAPLVSMAWLVLWLLAYGSRACIRSFKNRTVH